MALFHGFGVLPISNVVEFLQGCSLCLKEGNREEEPIPGPHLGILLQEVQDQLPQDEPRDRAALLGDGT